MDQNSGNSSLWFCDFIHSKFCFRQKRYIMQKSDRKEQLSNFREYLKTKKTCHLRALICNFRTFSKSRGHLTSPIWLKFGMKAVFRVLTTKWLLKSSSCFFLAKKIDKADLVCPYLPANMAGKVFS